jgi:hypothetical protein
MFPGFPSITMTICNYYNTVKPPIVDPPRRDHNRNNLSTGTTNSAPKYWFSKVQWNSRDQGYAMNVNSGHTNLLLETRFERATPLQIVHDSYVSVVTECWGWRGAASNVERPFQLPQPQAEIDLVDVPDDFVAVLTSPPNSVRSAVSLT